MSTLMPPYEYLQGYIVQKLPDITLPRKATLGRYEYYSRRQLHCSLLAVKNLIGLVQDHDGSTEAIAEQKILAAIEQIFQTNPPVITGITSEVRVASKLSDYKQTIVVMAIVEGLDDAFAELKKTLGFSMHTQPAHITLYTLENGLPIGLTSNEQVAKLTEVMAPEERAEFDKIVNLPAVFGGLYESDAGDLR